MRSGGWPLLAMGRLLKRTREGPRCDREPDVSKSALERFGMGRWAAGSCVWRVVVYSAVSSSGRSGKAQEGQCSKSRCKES